MKDNTFVSLLGTNFGVTFAVTFSVCVLVIFILTMFFMWWVDVKKRTIKSFFVGIKNGIFKACEVVNDFFANEKVKTVYSDKTLNFSGTEFLPIPSKEPNDKFTYEFVGWDKCGFDAQGNVVVKAIYLQKTKKIIVNVYDDDKATQLKSFEIDFGAGIDLTGLCPEKPETKEFSYEFAGWDKDIKAFYKNENVYAVYRAIPKKFTYTFFDEDKETIVSQGTAIYGTPIFAPPSPVKQNENGQVFRFSYWRNFKDDMILTKDCYFVAQYQSSPESSVFGSTVVDISGEQHHVDSVQIVANRAEEIKSKPNTNVIKTSSKASAPKLDFEYEKQKKQKRESRFSKKNLESQSSSQNHSQPVFHGINMASIKADEPKTTATVKPVTKNRKMKIEKATTLPKEKSKPALAPLNLTDAKDDEDMKDLVPLTAQKTENITNSAKKKEESEEKPFANMLVNRIKIAKKNN